ncbi:MAG: cobalamin biosynthesis protein [Candidatus Omnitrophica bacterium]|nr:cobalamin biosynthesis protein [Candidatus Omnitrophota bacterium]
MTLNRKLWLGIGVLAILSPLGLILPEYFKAGAAWGEWSPDEIQRMAGYLPSGLARLSAFWQAPAADYSWAGWPEKGLLYAGGAYILSAVAGIVLTAGIVFIIGRLLVRKTEKTGTH